MSIEHWRLEPKKRLLFSIEVSAKLIEAGYRIYKLKGQSLETLRNAGFPFWTAWHKDYPVFETLPSRLSEVAINPDQLFLPDSNNKTLKQQVLMVEQFSRGLNLEEVEAVLGEAPDYEELVFTATEERLFGEKYDFCYTRTKTPVSKSRSVGVGGLDAKRGLGVRHFDLGRGFKSLFAAPLLVPRLNLNQNDRSAQTPILARGEPKIDH